MMAKKYNGIIVKKTNSRKVTTLYSWNDGEGLKFYKEDSRALPAGAKNLWLANAQKESHLIKLLENENE